MGITNKKEIFVGNYLFEKSLKIVDKYFFDPGC